MGQGFDNDFLHELKSRNDIVDVISSYVPLQKKGNNYWACCPFHHEKTPSFSVSQDEQFYHCFGCGVSGDVIKFVQEIESVEFMDAVRILADRAKMEVPSLNFDNERSLALKKKKDNLYEILRKSAKFYLNNLYSGQADKHVQYIADRKLSPTIVRKFGLGASLNFKDLPTFLLDSGFSKEDILDSGVCGQKDERLFDAQAGRLIIPIINNLEEVVAFGGRLLEKSDFAKYKNTRETLLFNKSKNLYNINLLKKLKKEENIPYVIMVEGYMDTITLYQAGFKNVVASMGTSLTKDQARLAKRYSENILISYDGDFAGQKADLRSLEILKDENIKVKVVPLPDGLDPDDVVKKQGAEAYQSCLDRAMPLIDYRIASLGKEYDLTKAEGKRSYAAEAIKVIREDAQSDAEAEDLLQELSERTGFTKQALKNDLQKASIQTKISPPLLVKEDNSNKEVKAARFILASILFKMPYSENYQINLDDFENDVHKIIATYILECKEKSVRICPSDLFEILSEDTPEYGEILDLNYQEKLTGANAEKYFKDCVKVLRQKSLYSQLAKFQELTQKAETVEERRQYAQEMTNILKKLKE